MAEETATEETPAEGRKAKRQKSEATAARQAQAEKQAKEQAPCLCGCGGVPKGGKFLPGHDAKFHSMLKKQEKEKATSAEKEKVVAEQETASA